MGLRWLSAHLHLFAHWDGVCLHHWDIVQALGRAFVTGLEDSLSGLGTVNVFELDTVSWRGKGPVYEPSTEAGVGGLTVDSDQVLTMAGSGWYSSLTTFVARDAEILVTESLVERRTSCRVKPRSLLGTK